MMPNLDIFTGLANQACSRCYKRKKRCDKNLPRCRPCALAKVECSFEDARNETGVFQVAYVRSLELRVKKLERELLRYQSAFVNAVQNCQSPDAISAPHDSNTGISTSPASVESPENLESEVKLFSLETTAERYFRSSSGVTFSRLAQAVMKGLRADVEPFSSSSTSQLGSAPSADAFSPCSSMSNSPGINAAIRSITPLPTEDHAFRLADYYWCHSHTLYPFIPKAWFMGNLKKMYTDLTDETLVKSHSWLYTMWMVFAIGSTSLSSVMIEDETKSAQYWSEAMKHFDSTLQDGNMTALKSIMLQVHYSFFNQIGPNTWYLIGMAIRIAQGMGLHSAPAKANPGLPKDAQESRARVFYSLYAMDRVVSVTLGRPLGLRDDDIEIECFSPTDDVNILPDRILPHRRLTLPETAVPLHIVSLRKLSGCIFQEVYSSRNSQLQQFEKDSIIHNLHERLIDWRRNMPFPLPELRGLRVPHLTTAWYDLNYHNHVIMLYRPSPLFPVIRAEKLSILAEAAAMSLRQLSIMRNNQSFSFNWLNLFSLFTTTLALIYAITAQPQTLADFLSSSDALNDLRFAAELLEVFGRKFPSAHKYQNMVQEVITRMESYLPLTETRRSSYFKTSSFSENQSRPWTHTTSSNYADTSYPARATRNPVYDDLASQLQVPKVLQLNGKNGNFDDFAAHGLVAGFAMSGAGVTDGEDDDLMRYFNIEEGGSI